MAWLDSQGLGVMSDGFLDFLLIEKTVRQIAVGLGAVRPDPQDFGKMLDGLLHLPLPG
jgi:hypothetical protein